MKVKVIAQLEISDKAVIELLQSMNGDFNPKQFIDFISEASTIDLKTTVGKKLQELIKDKMKQ